MILATFRNPADGQVAVGAVDRNKNLLLDLQHASRLRNNAPSAGFESMLDLIAGGERVLDQARKTAGQANWDGPAVHCLADVKLLSPIPVPPQIRDFSVTEQHMRQAIIAIGKLRAKRTGIPAPAGSSVAVSEVIYKQPIYYKGNRFSVIGHDEDVKWPRYSSLLDYELEFGIFLAAQGKDIPASQAHRYIFGYTVFNDFSARDAQEVEMAGALGPAKGKDFDTGNAIGPWIATEDEIADAHALTMVARVNGEEWSRNNSRCMLHTFEDMIAHVSRDETLYPGEFFGSGTVGNGCGLEMDRWLKPDDVIELEVEGIGVLRNRVVLPIA